MFTTLTWAFHAALSIFIISSVFQCVYMARITFSWMKNVRFREAFHEHVFFFALVFLVSITNIESVLILSCKLFNNDIFAFPLNKNDEDRISRLGVLGVFLESIPQFVIQILVALELKQLDAVVGFALLMSVIQLLISLIKHIWLYIGHQLTQNNRSDQDIMNSMEMKERMEESMGELYQNLMKYDDPSILLDKMDDGTLRYTFDMYLKSLNNNSLRKVFLHVLKYEKANPSSSSSSIHELSMHSKISSLSKSSSLPEGWSRFENEEGVPYYYNNNSATTQWSKPPK